MKTCPACGKQKSLEEFTWKLKAKGIRHASCRDCMRLYVQEHYKKNTDKKRAEEIKLFEKRLTRKYSTIFHHTRA